MSVRVKICGINSAEAYKAAADAGADWVGFNFFPHSPRYVTPAQAARLAGDGPQRVGLLVDPEDTLVAEALEALRLDALQVYASAERVAELRKRFGTPIWRAVGIAGAADLPRDLSGADALLVEPKAPPEALRPGGNAQRLDWSVLSGWAPTFPWILAGGLDPANVAAAIRASGAAAVDVSSGVECSPGEKDPALIRAFIAAARAG